MAFLWPIRRGASPRDGVLHLIAWWCAASRSMVVCCASQRGSVLRHAAWWCAVSRSVVVCCVSQRGGVLHHAAWWCAASCSVVVCCVSQRGGVLHHTAWWCAASCSVVVCCVLQRGGVLRVAAWWCAASPGGRMQDGADLQLLLLRNQGRHHHALHSACLHLEQRCALSSFGLLSSTRGSAPFLLQQWPFSIAPQPLALVCH